MLGTVHVLSCVTGINRKNSVQCGDWVEDKFYWYRCKYVRCSWRRLQCVFNTDVRRGIHCTTHTQCRVPYLCLAKQRAGSTLDAQMVPLVCHWWLAGTSHRSRMIYYSPSGFSSRILNNNLNLEWTPHKSWKRYTSCEQNDWDGKFV
jgi:hypothetical protein